MISWLDGKLAGNGLAQHAIESRDPRLLFGLAAEACVGIYESGGNNNGPLVKLIQETIGRAEGEPWCLSFVQTCLAYAEVKTGVASPVFVTEHCRTCWQSTPVYQRVKISPLKYAIVLWGYEGSSSGHAGIVTEVDQANRKWIKTIEGNTNQAGSREGDGVYYKQRDFIRNGSLVRLGFLRPF